MSVGIWTEKWLPKPSIFIVISPPSNAFELSRVCDLIDPLMYEWQTGLARQVFLRPDVQSILSIPFSSCLPRVRLVWVDTPEREFTVCGVYIIALDKAMNSGVGEPSNGDTHRKFWRKSCSLNMPNKVKTFAWRACQTYAECMCSLWILYSIY